MKDIFKKETRKYLDEDPMDCVCGPRLNNTKEMRSLRRTVRRKLKQNLKLELSFLY